MPDRAVVFVDGNNWYHGLRDRLNLPDLLELDYAALSRKLLGPRDWIGTRYYIGRVQQRGNTQLYANQRSFLTRLTEADSRISCHLGRLESRKVPNEAADELRRAAYLLSADGDFTPAVEAVKSLGKKVYAATPRYGAELAAVVNAFIRLDAPWFRDCYVC